MDKKVLLVGASAAALSEVKNILERRGYDVKYLHDGREALGVFYAFEPSLVVCDHQVASLSGIEMCDLVKRHPSGQKVIFILITHLPKNPRLVEELAQRVQADELIGKPYSVSDVLTKIDQWMDSSSRPVPIFAREFSSDLGQAKKAKPLPTEGNLGDVAFVKLLYQLHHRRFSGELILNDKRKRMRVVFRHGDPLTVQSNYIREDALGRLLVVDRKISNNQLEQAIAHQQDQKVKLGEALIALEMLSPEELQLYLEKQSYRKLLGACRRQWRSGTFLLRPGLSRYNSGNGPFISTVRLIQDGIQDSYPLDRLNHFFDAKGRQNKVLRATGEIDVVYGKLLLDQKLRMVIEHLRRGIKLHDLEVMVQIDQVKLYHFIYTLLVLHAVRFDKIEEQLPVALSEEEQTEIRARQPEPTKQPPQVDDYAEYNRNLYLGRQFFQSGQYEKALPLLRQALSHKADCGESLAMIGWCYYNLRPRSDRYVTEEAKEYLRKAIDNSPSCAIAYLFLAKILKNENNQAMYERYARKAHQLDPKHPEIAREYDLSRIRRRKSLS